MALPTETVSTDRPSAVPGGFREIVPLAFPVVLTQLSATAMGVVDSAMVGRLGPTELAAVGFSSVWIWTIISIFYGTASGVQTFVSQADGAGDPRSCGSWAWQGLYALTPAVLVVVTLVWAQVENAVALLGPSAEMQVAATAYVRARIFGELGFTLLMVLSSFFRGIGDTRTPLYVSLGANAVYSEFGSAHNIFIDDAGYMYLEFPGLRIYDLNPDPTNPTFLWSKFSNSGHDATVVGNRLYDFRRYVHLRRVQPRQPRAPRLDHRPKHPVPPQRLDVEGRELSFCQR